MFKRYEVTAYRATFWFLSIVLYWVLVFLAWWNTRFRVFLGYEVFMEISARKRISAILANMDALTERAWLAIAESGSLPGVFLTIPLVMALVMFAAPFIVRRDYHRPVRGAFMLPIMALLCYLFAMLMNMVVAASMELALHHYLHTRPSPDFFMFLVHPLYLLYPPALKSVPGFFAQVIYVIFICSVLTTKGRRRFVPHEESAALDAPPGEVASPHNAGGLDESDEPDENITACTMETDRLCRIIDAKVSQPSLVHEIRGDIVDYIRIPFQIENDVNMGMEHYRIVLLEAAKSLRRIVEENPARPGACDAFEYVVGEMERMEYCTADDCVALRSWLAMKRPAQEKQEA